MEAPRGVGKRRFSGRERAALHLAAGGRCERCGTKLTSGWHADHVVPYSEGGHTDVINGAALCPSCNLKKGNLMVAEPRENPYDWQVKALDNYKESGRTDFLAVATPGAGKTRFALACMDITPAFYIIVVPTSRLRTQWADVAAKDPYGIQLEPTFENSLGDDHRDDFDGIVVTYQGVAAAPHVYRRLASRQATMVVLDEVHHCGDEKSWGDAIRYAFEPAQNRLLLSGTPFRGDNNPIPFVTYDGDPPRSQADYTYGYARALANDVVRAVEFASYDARARWSEAGKTIEIGLSEAVERDEGRALTSALLPDSEWMQLVLPTADTTLARIRRDIPNAGGLVIANSQSHAETIGAQLSRLIGRRVPVAVSKDSRARDVIDEFDKGTDPWLVAVNMVSEGVDIPRLMVGVYATSNRTELFFRQAVGRFVRIGERNDETDTYPATVFVPSVGSILTLARDMESERDHVLAQLSDESELLDKGDGDEDIRMFDLVEPLRALDPKHVETILSGESLTPAELQRAMELCAQVGLGGASPTQIARLLRIAGAGKVVGQASVTTSEQRPDYQEHKALRADLSRLVKKHAYYSKQPHRAVWDRLHKYTGDGVTSVQKCTIDQLRERVRIVVGWLAE